MASNLLSTKLYIPQKQPNLVPRQRLIEHLTDGLNGKVTLISAPAGFGKTTLLSEWIHTLGYPVTWLSLDKKDNDLSRFLTYVIAALQKINEQIGIDIQAVLKESQSLKLETVLTKLINDIGVIQEPFIFILDDYHLIESESVNNALNFLIEFQPQIMHLVISGRSDPLLPISRLRVRGELSEIRISDLRFTNEETAFFLNDLMGFDLSPENICTMEERTEGWVASLQLAAISMRGRDDWPEFIAAFSGSHRYVIDYLADETMSQQPEEVRIFLRRISILEKFCEGLCEEVVTGEVSGDTNIIDHLEQSNLFLVPLDDQKEWYRFHHLFADFLRLHLHKEEPEKIPELHRRASQWFENKGLIDEAIQHALAARDVDRAARLIMGIAGLLVVRRYSNVLLNWVNQLPAETCQKFPMLCVWQAWALIFQGQPNSVERILKSAEANKENTPEIPIHGYVSTVRAYLANLMGDFQLAIDLSKQALDQMSDASSENDTLIFRGAAVIWLGVNYRILGNFEKAKDLFVEAVKLNEEAGSIYAAISAKCQLANMAIIQGQLFRAKEIYEEGCQIVNRWVNEQAEGQPLVVAASELYIGLGTLLYEWNDLKSAAVNIQRATELLELAGDQGLLDAYRIMAYLDYANEDFEGAFELIGKISTFSDITTLRRNNSLTEPRLEKLFILLSRACPEMAHLLIKVAENVESMGILPDDEINFSTTGYVYEIDYSNLARALIALDRAQEALPLIKRLIEGAHSMGRLGDEIRYTNLYGLAHHALGDTSTAIIYLNKALVLAKPQGYVRLFVDEGKLMAELLQTAISQNIEPAYTEELFAAFPSTIRNSIDVHMPKADSQKLIEPLSKRELEVLKLMTKGYRYKEIAEELIISLNTVRHHTRNIYSKLNINNRAQAIAKANDLSLF